MNLRVVHAAAIGGLALALQLATPAIAQEAQAKNDLQQQPASSTHTDSDSAVQSVYVDAPSASLSKESSQTAPVTFAQVQQAIPMTSEETEKHQDAARPTQPPQGAAAAHVQPATGTAASEPAGAAIAPAKQRRVRSYLIRLGAVAGAGIAVGTVFALSSASPSRPPGSH